MTVHETYSYRAGDTPLLVSVPHDGRDIPPDLQARMAPAGLDIPDTDWHVARLYDFAHGEGASILVAHCSRYVVDLNRSPDDGVLYLGQVVTGLCPETTFAGEPIYRAGEAVSPDEQAWRVETYWKPYHERIRATLDELRERFGYALLWDAHSIPSQVPRLFDGDLPVLNVGTYDARSCADTVADAVFEVAEKSPYEAVLNARFKGGYITRHYGDPEANIMAIQLEIAQRAYMNEDSRDYHAAKADELRVTLQEMLKVYRQSTKRVY